MKVTIIPSDQFCSVDGVGYMGVDVSSVPSNIHAVQFNGASGWIEYETLETGEQPPNEPINNVDSFAGVIASWEQIDYKTKNPPPPQPPTAEQNKAKASALLKDTDWTQIPSVSDPQQSNPYLANAAEFAAYRTIIREIAVNPVAGDIDWAVVPDAVWQSV